MNTGGLGGLESKYATVAWGEEMMDGVSDWINRFVDAFAKVPLPEKTWA